MELSGRQFPPRPHLASGTPSMIEEAPVARLLVVDDDVDVREWVAHCVRQDGHTVTYCATAEEALRGWDKLSPEIDAVLLDYALPGLDGVALLTRLRETRPDLAAIFVTVQWSGQIIERIARTGAEHIAKPFAPDTLRTAVLHALTGPGEPTA